MQKLYCYVDETGQDTQGRLFAVGTAILYADRDAMASKLEALEQAAGKHGKWIRTPDPINLAYMRAFIAMPANSAKLCFAIHYGIQEYLALTVSTIAAAMTTQHLEDEYEATFLIDGLPRKDERAVGTMLRRHGIQVHKVRGIKKEETDVLSRLADAVCGLTRDALTKPKAQEVFNLAVRRGLLTDVSGR